MAEDIHVEKEASGKHGRYVARIDGVEGAGELAFTVQAPGRISADHTETPTTMRGRGVGEALIEGMVADARASGFRIIPICPYVRAQSQKHPEWGDVIAAPGPA
jgi:predicted GNAT family acetyltransferase